MALLAEAAQARRRPRSTRASSSAAEILGPRARCSTAIRASSRAASASASPWAAPSCATRRCSCSTSRSPTSTPSCASQMRTEIKELHQRLEDHHGLRHARPDRGHDHGRQDRGHARRHRRADRRAARALRPAGQPVRGGLHRLAGDELPAGQDARPAAPSSFEAERACVCRSPPRRRARTAGPAVYGIRPEHFALADDGVAGRGRGGRADRLGDAGRRQARRQEIVACSASATRSSPGETIRLAPDPALVHLFDAETGQRLMMTPRQQAVASQDGHRPHRRNAGTP